MQRRKFEVSVKSAQMQQPVKLQCPYTSGSATSSSVCPLTGIDVSKTAHSEVIQAIDKKVWFVLCASNQT